MTFEIVNATVESVFSLTPTMLQYFIKPDRYVNYIAGQYLQIIIAKDVYSYSIANAPIAGQHYELHIRYSSNSHVLSAMQKNANIMIKLPLGDCSLLRMKVDMPILFIAVGSGYAPINAMLEQLFKNSDKREKKLYWVARTENDFYMNEKIVNWQKNDKNFTYHSFVLENIEDLLIEKLINENSENLLNYQIVMCGPFELIYKMRDALLARGVIKDNMYSDAFSFE